MNELRISSRVSARIWFLLILVLGIGAPTSNANDTGEWSESELEKARTRILSLKGLTAAPLIRDPQGKPVLVTPGEMHAIFYDALPYKGQETRAFALIKLPEGATTAAKVPGIVLVHGGGGSAFEEWVELWVAHGYAAISIAVEGQTGERQRSAAGNLSWVRHDWAGPQRVGIYGDMGEQIEDQWMYHAVADTVLANSLLRSLPAVDVDRVGVMGISWGGVITSTVIGIDNRFAFAIPVYGCGHKFDSENQYGKALGESELYQKAWDPIVRLHRASMPVQWLSWPGDKHFPMDAFAASYRQASGPRLVTLIPGMKHGHGAAWRRPDSYAFADSIVRDKTIWAQQTDAELDGERYLVRFRTTKPADEAVLVSTVDTGFSGNRAWTQSRAKLSKVDGEWLVASRLPPNTTAWFVNLKSGDLTVSSDFEQR